MTTEIKPYIPASKTIREFTLLAVLLGVGLSLIMCAANVYVGLYAGMTVSAAIPASVISMGVLRGLLRRGTILENNIVHTIASSGESLAAGIIFTVPALVLLGIWTEFNYWETTLIAMAGGVMGVVMMIPLRKPMIIEQKELRFPEGVACAEVLKAGDRGGAQMLGIFWALGIGALFKALITVVGLFKGSVEWGWRISRSGFYIGTDISPMLMAVGFIVGWEVSLLVFVGGAISFVGAIPMLAWGVDFGTQHPTEVLMGIWDAKIRFVGIGAMVVAGIYSIIKIAGSMGAALRTALRGLRGLEDTASLPRTEQGISGRALFGLMGLCVVLSGTVYFIMTGSVVTTAITTVAMFILAFFFVAVASYIVGLVGSSNSPVSGMTICTVLLTAGLLLMLGYTGTAGMLATLGVAGVVCCAACTAGDICQDLKIGQIVGATPRRLQMGEVIGALLPAFIIAPVMQLLNDAYGIGTPAREGVQALKAPQGVMFEKLVGGIFGSGQEIPWDLVGWGAAIGVVAILIDRFYLEPRKAKFRLHAMPLAVGMYLPWTVTFPILIGGMVYKVVEKRSAARGDSESERQSAIHRGLLFSSGLVAGEAIMGILIALLVIAKLDMPFINLAELGLPPVAIDLLSLLALFVIIVMLVRKAMTKDDEPAAASEG
ncbi:MAG: oligopeptide transporter, OPT family [Deltaproteobacteria bacterium]|nr:MAG: oligopeptide transporter, OPT family [Deltaproteobacteria bacterium]